MDHSARDQDINYKPAVSFFLYCLKERSVNEQGFKALVYHVRHNPWVELAGILRL